MCTLDTHISAQAESDRDVVLMGYCYLHNISLVGQIPCHDLQVGQC